MCSCGYLLSHCTGRSNSNLPRRAFFLGGGHSLDENGGNFRSFFFIGNFSGKLWLVNGGGGEYYKRALISISSSVDRYSLQNFQDCYMKKILSIICLH